MERMISGRQERDIKILKQIEAKIKDLPVIFTEYFHDMQGDDKSLLTIKQYIERVSKFAADLFGENIPEDFYRETETTDIKKYLVQIPQRDTAALTWSALKSFYGFLVLENEIKENPMMRIRRPSTKKEHVVTYMTEDEIRSVFENVQKKALMPNVKRDRAIISLFLATGLRCSALRQINISDIDMIHRTIRVVEKGNKIREIPYGEEMVGILNDWLADRKMYYPDVETDALFVSEQKQRITHSSINRLIEKYTQDLDKHITSHKLRSTAATMLAAQGTNVQTIKEVLGHNNVQTTMRYIAAVQQEKQEAVHTLDSLLVNHERGKT